MRVGIDASMLVYQGSGVATYTFNLIKSLLRYYPGHEYRIFYSSLRRPKNVSKQLREIEALGGKVYSFRLPPRALNFLWNKKHFLPVEWIIGKVDAFLSSDYLRPPLLKGTLGITTIHDLTWKLFPNLHTPNIVEAHARKLAKTIEYSDYIIVDSQNTEKDLFQLYPQAQKNNQVEVIYLGVDDKFRKVVSKTKLKKTLSKYKIKHPSDYLLYVGAIEPRKNLDRAIRVFSELIEDPKYQNYKFYIAGRAGWKNEKMFELIDKLNLKKRVIFLGFVEDEDLAALYSAAAATIYLSEYEGFGLPPLEAGCCGTPTLLYSNSSLTELFPSSYSYAKQGKELETLKNILSDKKLDVKKHTRGFTWDNYAKKFDRILTYVKK